jgi:membrane protease subunit HflK
VGLVTRFGRLTSGTSGDVIVHPPGLLLALPAPFDEVIRVPVLREESLRIDRFSPPGEEASAGDPRLMLTGDLALADVQLTVKYWITDAVRFVRGAADPRTVLERVVCAEAQAVMNRCSLDEVLRLRRERGGDEREPAATLPEAIRLRVERQLDAIGCGISVTSIEVHQVQPPADVRAAFENLQTARIDLEAARERARGMASERLIEAESLARQTVAEAQGSALARRAHVNESIGLFHADLAQERGHGGGQRERMRREALQRVIERSRKAVFVPDVPEGMTLRVSVPTLEAAR